MTSTPTTPTPIVWIDLETTGLHDADQILEIACIVTSATLDPVASDPFHSLVRPIDEGFDDLRMGPWAYRHHTESGLMAELEENWYEIPAPPQVDIELSSYISEEVTKLDPSAAHHALGIRQDPPEKPPLAGSSVNFDRRFIRRCLPLVDVLLHYRLIDVSGLREVARRVWPGDEPPPKSEEHRAIPDIYASLKIGQWFFGRARTAC